MGYEGLEPESLVTLEIVLSRALKTEKNEQLRSDIKHEHGRIMSVINER